MKTRYLMTVLTVFALTGAAQAVTIRVPKDQPTIQDAVNAANTGDVIEIKGGKYAEDVIVDLKTDLRIVGKGKVTLMPVGVGLTANNCTNLTIQKIGVQGGTTGFDFQACARVLLEKFAVKGVSVDGVHAAGSSTVRLVKGKITDCGRDGVSYADEEPGRPVSLGEVTKVKVKDCGEDGVDILGSNVKVSFCSVKDADDDGFESDEDGAGGITFEKCSAKNSGDEGFELYAPISIATNCKSIGSEDDGFDVEGDGSKLTNCTSIKSGSNGLEIEVTTNVTLTDCKAVKTLDGDGFAVLDATNCVLDGCKAVKSLDNGFFLDSLTSGITVRNCKAAKSGDNDLDDEGTGNTIEDNNRFKTIDPNP